MNEIRKKMLSILRELKQEYGVLAVKAEFEAEGSRLDELIMLGEEVYRADLDLFIKIGGCEAVRDLHQCKMLGASGIMAPMIETPFALKKFQGAAKKVYGDEINDIDWIINTETKTCNEHFNEILQESNGFVNTIAIGRVDLSASMGLERKDINSERMIDISLDFAKKAKKYGINVGIGGGVSLDSVPVLMRLSDWIDRYETRKIVFEFQQNENKIKKGLVLAMEFEMLYLENKCLFYDEIANEDRERMMMLQRRYKAAKSLIEG